MAGSSSTSGFFQALPTVPPLYTASRLASPQGMNVSDEQVFDRALRLYLRESIPEKVDTSIHNFTRLVIDPSTLRLTVDCETNQSKLKHLNTFGEENKAMAVSMDLLAMGISSQRTSMPCLGIEGYINLRSFMPGSQLRR
ncbi:hypothetical protein VC83_04757 [Pseudogymnoascus destructans]|uniref:Uncharacterized protein n=1 Tax=Pseudogymnoascus destructans TaxID=655981 RepID=A0A177A539_9PEZI|nr:uncharacterized protein VC83_04757 [Pseudogymnoascus destructans]OAF57365.1 hypothetical protein VC83_04757 [Pseudogymnoascus destructans]